MSEEDYQRGRRGGDFRIGGDWDDWKAGRDDLEGANREAERQWERELDAEIAAAQAASRPRLFSFADLVGAVHAAGYPIITSKPKYILYKVTLDQKTRTVIASENDDYVYFVTRTRFRYDNETDFPRDLLYRALLASDAWYETYFAITHSKLTDDGHDTDTTKLILAACNDKWKGILNAEWLPGIHTNLFGLSAAIEGS